MLFKMLRQRRFLTLATFFACIFSAAVTLWWNAQLGDIINSVGQGRPLFFEDVAGAAAAMLLLLSITAYGKSYVGAYTCESLAHDLRMGCARHLGSLSFSETEKLSEGKQLSLLQNEIADQEGRAWLLVKMVCVEDLHGQSVLSEAIWL